MARRSKRSEKENSERWLITYSDLITLLMIFFVIMYAMSQINQVKFLALEKSLNAALHQSDKIPMQNMGQTSLVEAANASDTGNKTKNANVAPTTQDHALDNLYQQVKLYISQHHLQANVSIVNQQRGVQITLRDVVLFDTGQAAIRPTARSLLAGLVPFFQSLPNAIVVEGYTDNVPINTPQFPSNWELSAARAIDVVRFLVSRGVEPSRLSGVGYGSYHPIVPNNSEAHRQMNRRVNIVVLRQAPLNLPVSTLPPASTNLLPGNSTSIGNIASIGNAAGNNTTGNSNATSPNSANLP